MQSTTADHSGNQELLSEERRLAEAERARILREQDILDKEMAKMIELKIELWGMKRNIEDWRVRNKFKIWKAELALKLIDRMTSEELSRSSGRNQVDTSE